jgi:hypothetical protein
VVRTVRPIHSHLPNEAAEYDHKEKKENTHNFKPDDSADTLKGAQESANPAGDAPCSLAGDLSSRTALRSAGTRIGGLGNRSWPACGSLRAGGYALPGNAAGNAKTDPKSATNGLGLHSDLMVTAWLANRLS